MNESRFHFHILCTQLFLYVQILFIRRIWSTRDNISTICIIIVYLFVIVIVALDISIVRNDFTTLTGVVIEHFQSGLQCSLQPQRFFWDLHAMNRQEIWCWRCHWNRWKAMSCLLSIPFFRILVDLHPCLYLVVGPLRLKTCCVFRW